MNIYIDESGSINNQLGNLPFIISIVHVINFEQLSKAYKRFVSSNLTTLKELDKDFYNKSGVLAKPGNQMFKNNKFVELKGSQFDPEMKRKFITFITKKKYFELYYVKINNDLLSNKICNNTARAFNYSLKLAITAFIKKKLFPDEDCFIQLDERNERTEAKFFLENYLNTELLYNDITNRHFSVRYLNSETNPFIQIADIFANLFYSQINTNAYTDLFKELTEKEILKEIFEFPLREFKS